MRFPAKTERRVAFGLPYLLIELFNIGIPVVRIDGRAYGHVITKFSRMGRLPHFLTHGAPQRALRARAPLKYSFLKSLLYISPDTVWWNPSMRGLFEYSQISYRPSL